MPVRREHRSLFPELFEWLDWPMTSRSQQAIRFEDYIKDDRYVLRAELPGIDPEKDVDITLHNGVLTVHAERREESKEQQRTEFRYGSFSRSITLPPEADEQDVKAVYDKGILEVSVKLREQEQQSRRIQIERTQG
jgi:HSP20 family molecular chaperone IbpA